MLNLLQQELVDSSGEPLDQLVSRCLLFLCHCLIPSMFPSNIETGSLLAHMRLTGCLVGCLIGAVLCALSQCCHTVNHLLFASPFARFFMAIKYEEYKQTELATLHATLIVALLHLTFMQLLLEFFDIYAGCFVEDLFPLWQA